MSEYTHYSGKVALVTGGASGIGTALGIALARRGATVVLADIDDVAAKGAADDIAAGPPGRVSGTGLDVRDPVAPRLLIDSGATTMRRLLGS